MHVQPPAENKVDGVMEAVPGREGEGDGAPSAEIEVRHRGETEEVIFLFPSRVRQAFCDIGLVLYQRAPPEKELRLRIRQGKIRGDFSACGYPPP